MTQLKTTYIRQKQNDYVIKQIGLMIQLYWLQLYCYNNAKHRAEFRNEPQSVTMQRNLRHIGDMMHYRPPIRHFFGGRVPLSPAGFTPLRRT